MSSRIPDKPSDFEAEGIPDPGFAPENDDVTGQGESTMEPPHDTALAVDDYGTTAAEQREGEPVSVRVAREEPDVLAAVDQEADESYGSDTPFDERAGQGIGRLVEPDEGARGDTEADMVARDAGTDLGGYSAEEAAMHLEPEV